MRLLSAIAVATVWAGVASAADKLEIGAPDAWVRPVDIPSTKDARPDTAAAKLLLQDDQFDLRSDKQTHYFETAYRIQTPQGLPIGSTSLSWDPDTQAITIHKLLIHRGEQVIDVLASGQKFMVIRRETDLENAVLDGVLTATIQPEGLQVGDIVDFAATIRTADPALGRHVEQTAAQWNNIPIARAHLRVQWPSTQTMRLRETGGLPDVKPVSRGGVTSVELSLDDLSPTPGPKGAPMRFQYGRIIEMSDLGSWSGIADLMAPLYVKAAVTSPQGAVPTEIARIRAQVTDPKARAEAALALVQDRVRYVFLGLNDGGLVPADAETTWSRRFGDCKGKTVLLLALLRGLDIEAEPVAVSTSAGDGLDQRLPMIAPFNHVLVRATIAGRAYWLDGTRTGDRQLDGLDAPAYHWGLPLVAGTAALIPIITPPLTQPALTMSVRIDASNGILTPAPAHVERLLRGDEAVEMNIRLADMTDDARDRALRDFWKEKYDFIDVKTTTATFDAVRRELKLSMDGDARMEWNDGFYEADDVWVGYKADFRRDAGADRDAPFAVNYPFFTHVTETILLPPHGGAFTVDTSSEVDATVAGIAYQRHAEVSGGRFTVDESERSLAPEFPAADAPAAQAALRDLFKRTVYLKQPANYWRTDAEVEAAMKSTPNTAAGYIDRGDMLIDRARFDEAIADLTKAAALEPKNARALAVRGFVRAWKRDVAAAKQDLDAAEALDPRNAVVFRARGLLFAQASAFKEAIAAFTTSLEFDPGNTWTIEKRTDAYASIGEWDLALADLATLVAQRPDSINLYVMRVRLLQASGRPELAAREADALISANPGNDSALVVAARIYADAGRRTDAAKAFDRALAIKPSAMAYINRSEARPKSDFQGRLADLDEALKLEPRSIEALGVKGDLQEEQGDWRGALATLSQANAIKADNPQILSLLAVAYLKTDQKALADQDFQSARRLAKTATSLNTLCWAKAIAGVQLTSALADCDAALAMNPKSAAALDSRGLVLLRLGRIDEAIEAYNQALALRPDQAGSLYGRAIAEARLGRTAESERDAAAALKADPETGGEYQRYGLTIETRRPDSKINGGAGITATPRN